MFHHGYNIRAILYVFLNYVVGVAGVLGIGFSVILYKAGFGNFNRNASILFVISFILIILFEFLRFRAGKTNHHTMARIVKASASLAIVLVMGWIIIFLMVYFFQDQVIYQKQEITAETLRHIKANYSDVEEISIMTDDTTKLHGWYIHHSDIPGPLILYFGGGAENITKRIESFYRMKGWSTALINYRGYGLSEGTPSEEKLLSDSLDIYEYFAGREEIDNKKIVVMGRSLGTGIAAYLASKRQLKGVILVSPYDSMRNWLQQKIPFIPSKAVMKSPFDTFSIASSIKVETLCILGDRDNNIPIKSSTRLMEKWAGNNHIKIVQNSNHDSILYDEECWYYVKEFLSTMKFP